MTFYSAIRPYSQAERDADEAARRRAQRREVGRRQACADKQRYAQPGNRERKKRDLRLMGESE